MFVKCNPSVPTVNIIPVKATKIPKVYDIIIDLFIFSLLVIFSFEINSRIYNGVMFDITNINEA